MYQLYNYNYFLSLFTILKHIHWVSVKASKFNSFLKSSRRSYNNGIVSALQLLANSAANFLDSSTCFFVPNNCMSAMADSNCRSLSLSLRCDASSIRRKASIRYEILISFFLFMKSLRWDIIWITNQPHIVHITATALIIRDKSMVYHSFNYIQI